VSAQQSAKYLTDCCVAVSHTAGRQRLRSTAHAVTSWMYRAINEQHSAFDQYYLIKYTRQLLAKPFVLCMCHWTKFLGGPQRTCPL